MNKRTSSCQPKVRSSHNVALVKDLELSDTAIIFQVKSTLDTGNHRDCCVFFNWPGQMSGRETFGDQS